MRLAGIQTRRARTLVVALSMVAIAACGDESDDAAPAESAPDVADATGDVAPDATPDAAPDAAPDGPIGPGNNDSVCCETELETVYTTNVACEEAGGAEIPIGACPELCCDNQNGTYSWIAPESCAGDGGIPSHPGHCAEVCCEIEGQEPSYQLQGNCAFQGGVEVAAEVCEEPPAEVCCKTEGGIAWTLEADCPELDVLPDDLCETEFCCKVMDGPDVGNAYMSAWPDCEAQGGSVVYDGYCEQTVCCATDDGNVLVPYMDCTFLQLTETTDCDPVQEEACCKIMTGQGAGDAILATATDCAEQGGAFVTDDYCTQEICCKTEDGPQLMAYVDCTFLELTETAACDPPEEEGCCKDMENPGLGDAWIATPEECIAQGGSPIFQEYCDQEVCCDMGEGPQWMPYSDCTFFAMVATYDASESGTPCTPPEEEQCCKISFGVDTGNVVMATPTACAELGGIVTVQDYCEQEVCCETDAGMEFLPFLECPFLSVNETNACTPPEEEGCCQIILGPSTGNVLLATPTDCAVANGLPYEMAMCEQILCCSTEDGPQLLPFLECPFLDVLETDQCPEDEPACCKISAGPDTGNVLMATPTECAALEGVITDLDYCEQLMCCNTEDGPQQVPFLECAFSDLNFEADACKVCCDADPWPLVVDQSACDEGSVLEDEACDVVICCSNGEGAYFEGTATECAAEAGSVVDNALCAPDELICCALAEGNLYILDSECKAQGGTQAAPGECVVCCEYPAGGIGEDPAEFCLAGGGTIVDDALCAPDELVCCSIGEDNEYILASECAAQSGTEAAPSECTACCQYPGGGIGIDPVVFCLAGEGTIVDDALCAPEEPICCSIGEESSYIPPSECTEAGGSETVLTACQVCCKNPFGQGPEFVFEADCAADQIQPDSVCE